jgi:hypothetical protein
MTPEKYQIFLEKQKVEQSNVIPNKIQKKIVRLLANAVDKRNGSILQICKLLDAIFGLEHWDEDAFAEMSDESKLNMINKLYANSLIFNTQIKEMLQLLESYLRPATEEFLMDFYAIYDDISEAVKANSKIDEFDRVWADTLRESLLQFKTDFLVVAEIDDHNAYGTHLVDEESADELDEEDDEEEDEPEEE